MPKVTITPFEHWCTDGNCAAEVLETQGTASKIRRYKVSIQGTPYSYGFNTEAEAKDFVTKHGYTLCN